MRHCVFCCGILHGSWSNTLHELLYKPIQVYGTNSISSHLGWVKMFKLSWCMVCMVRVSLIRTFLQRVTHTHTHTFIHTYIYIFFIYIYIYILLLFMIFCEWNDDPSGTVPIRSLNVPKVWDNHESQISEKIIFPTTICSRFKATH